MSLWVDATSDGFGVPIVDFVVQEVEINHQKPAGVRVELSVILLRHLATGGENFPRGIGVDMCA